MFLQMMDPAHWLWASLLVLGAIGLSAVCIRHRKGTGPSLCSDCRYNDAALCNRVERPFANICTSYRPGSVQKPESEISEANNSNSE